MKGQLLSAKDFAFLEKAAVLRPSDPSGAFSEEAVLVSKSIVSNVTEFDDKTLKFLGQFWSKLNKSLVIKVLKLVKVPELAVRFFIWAAQKA